jgi:hypothetical protein
MKMPSYLENWTATYGHLIEFNFDPMAMRVCILGWDITVIAKMPRKGITLKMKAGVILGQQLAGQENRFLETIDKSCYPVNSSCMIIREQEAAGVCYLCAMRGHTTTP